MYLPIPSVKLLWSTLGLVTVILLSGCPSAPVVEDASVPQIPPVVTPDIDTATYHTVMQGETLPAIALRYGRNYVDIARWNNIPPPYLVSVGQQLRIDGPGSVSPEQGIPVVTPAPPAPTPIATPPISEPPNTGDTHTVQAKETLYSIAKLYGKKFQDLASWNNIAPPYNLGIGQVIRISHPAGWKPTSPTINEPLSKPIAPTTPVQEDRNHHVVLVGDTLYKIANHYGVSVADIVAWNGLQGNNISIGQKLLISSPNADNKLTVPPANIPPFSKNPIVDGGGYHTVIVGDTLYSLSRRYNQSVANLAKWNNLPPPYDLSLGQKLQVTPSPTMMPELTPKSPTLRPVGLDPLPGYHIVKQKETLFGIAKQYGVSVPDLAKWNDLGAPYGIYPGLRLTIIPQ